MKDIQRNIAGETAIAIALSLDVGKTQIQNIITDKDDILKRWESGENVERKYVKVRKCVYTDINDKLWDWFWDSRSRNIPLSGKMIHEKAIILSQELGHNDFMASNGWLDRWPKRTIVKCATLCGESGDVPQDVVDDWATRLPTLTEGYALENIFNADETGLYYCALPTKSMVAKNDSAAGVKMAKNRITMLLAVTAAGKKLKPLVIGNALKPWCFQGLDINSLGIEYYHNMME